MHSPSYLNVHRLVNYYCSIAGLSRLSQLTLQLDRPFAPPRRPYSQAGDQLSHGSRLGLADAQVGEPRVAALLDEDAFLAPRRRSPLARQDLAALGAEPDAALRFDLDVLDDAAAAWGSLYVVEGSTLGGLVISSQRQSHIPGPLTPS